MFDLLLRQYDAAKLDESKDAAIIQVVEPAIEPDRKSEPKRAVILAISAALGLIVGCLWACLLWMKELAHADPQTAAQLWALKNAFLR